MKCERRNSPRGRVRQFLFVLTVSMVLSVSLFGCAGNPGPKTGIFDAKSANYYRGLHASILERDTPTDRLLAAMSRTYLVDGSPVSSNPSLADLKLLDSAIQDAPSDPMLLWFVASNISDGSTRSVLVSKLQNLEPDNGAIGMLRLTDAIRSNDPFRTTEALEQIGNGRRFNEHFGDLTIAWLDAVRRHPWPSRSGESTAVEPRDAAIVYALSYASMFGFPAYMDLSKSCREGAVSSAGAGRDHACLAAAEAMLRGSDTIISRAIGNALLHRFDERRYELNVRKFSYQNETFGRLMDQILGDAVQIRLIEADWRQTRSELRVMERALQRAGISLIPPDDWAPAPGGVGPRTDSGGS